MSPKVKLAIIFVVNIDFQLQQQSLYFRRSPISKYYLSNFQQYTITTIAGWVGKSVSDADCNIVIKYTQSAQLLKAQSFVYSIPTFNKKSFNMERISYGLGRVSIPIPQIIVRFSWSKL